jgi:stress response protein SCP2
MGKKNKKDKKKWKKKKGYKNKYNKKNHHQKKKKKMGLGTKLLIGAGVCAVAVGGLYLGKYLYDKHKANERKKIQGPPSSSGYANYNKRELVDDGPVSPAMQKYYKNTDVEHYKNSMDTIPVPDALTIGLGWDYDANTDYDLLAAAYSADGRNLGFIQGTQNLMSLFNKAIQHTGDNDGTSDVDTVLGDSENIILDLRAVPSECQQIMFGALLVTPPLNPNESRPYIHMLPMLRPEAIQAQKAAGGTREIQYEDSDDSDSDTDDSNSNKNSPQYPTSGTRGIEDDDNEDDRQDFVKLFYSELNQYPAMQDQKGFVGGKLFRSGTEWQFTPYRMVVSIDAQYGLWPALDYYAKFNTQQSQPQTTYAQPNPYQYQQQQQQPPSFGYDSSGQPNPYQQQQNPYNQPAYGSGQQNPYQQPGFGSGQPNPFYY